MSPPIHLPMGASRGVRGASYTLLTPDNHYPSRLPCFPGSTVVKLVTPRLAPCRFGQYLVKLSDGAPRGAPVAPGAETFLYGLSGELSVYAGDTDGPLALGPGAFAYLPPSAAWSVGGGPGELIWLKRPYEPWPGLDAPGFVHGHRDDEPFAATDFAGFTRRELLPPGDPAFDFNMSLLRFEPGVGLPIIEVHDEEHGLYMTVGAGHYFLDGAIHEVREHDFVYMAPYCPQGFAALGPGPAEYLLYKDVYRDGF